MRHSVAAWVMAMAAVLAGVAQAQEAPDAEDAQYWLERMSRAVRGLNYEGVFVYRHGGELDSMRIVHRAGPDGEHERLLSLNGIPREVVRDDQRVTCILPDAESVLVDRRRGANPLSEVVPPDVEVLRSNYRLALQGSGRVAGRTATQLSIEPMDRFRYGYQLWLDVETGLLLRADLLGPSGLPVEQLMFTELRFPESIPTEELKPTVSGDGFTWYERDEDANKSLDNPQWRVTEVPPGFALRLSERRQLPGSEVPVEHRLFSDGLASVSVYVERDPGTAKFEGHSAMGAINAYGRVVDDHQVIVVGEVPAATVVQMARGVRPLEGGTQ